MRVWILAIATVAVLVGVAGGAYWFGGNGADEPVLVLNTAPATSDGIKVHGDWTVTVSNPDGGIDSVHEFENEFQHKSGSALLMWALMGEGVFKKDSGENRWSISLLRNSPFGGICKPSVMSQFSTSVVMNGPKIADTEAFQAVKTCMAKDDATVIDVVTLQSSLKSELAPSFKGTPTTVSVYGHNVPLTTKHLDEPISLVPGQVVSVTVRISFE